MIAEFVAKRALFETKYLFQGRLKKQAIKGLTPATVFMPNGPSTCSSAFCGVCSTLGGHYSIQAVDCGPFGLILQQMNS
jgi:hypothetical protein